MQILYLANRGEHCNLIIECTVQYMHYLKNNKLNIQYRKMYVIN